ncbi:MAG: YhdP family protein, partial [Alphaproteobacteria bacterium]
MLKKTLRGAIQLFGGLGAGLAIMMMLAAWQLSSGPISLAFLSPYVASTLDNFHKSFRIRFDDTILTWAGWDRTLDIRVINVRAIDAQDSVIAKVPELSLSLSAEALLKGVIAPKSIEMFRPSLKLVRHRDGRLELGFNSESEQSEPFLQRMLEQLGAAPDTSEAMSYLQRVNIFDADLLAIDRKLETSWNAPNTQMQLRRDATGIKGNVSMDVLVSGTERASLSIIGGYLMNEGRIDLGVEFSGVTPAAFAGLSPELSHLEVLEVPLQGTVTFSMTTDGSVEGLGFDVSGGKGHLAVSLEEAQEKGDLSLAQRVAVESLEFRGRYEGRPQKIEINNLTINFGDQGKVYLPAPISHALPVRSLNVRGRYLGEDKRLELDSLEADLHGPEVSVAANFVFDADGLSLGASGVVRNMGPDELSGYWPKGMGSDARQWIVKNISGGIVPEARAAVQMRISKKTGIEILTLKGDMDIRDVTVDYLAPMPAAGRTNATARFSKEKFDIFITHSEIEGLTLKKGIISFSGLDKVDQFADIDLFLSGSLDKALGLIESEPLGYASAIGIDPERTGGTVDAHLKLGFLVEDALTTDAVKITASAQMQGVSIADVILGQSISDGELDLRVDKAGMDITGDVKLGNIPVDLKWRRNFGDNVAFRGRYHITSNIKNIRNLADLGLDLSPLHGDVVEGGVGADIRLTLKDENVGQVQIKLDLGNVALNIPAMGWSKEAGVAGMAEADIDLNGTVITDIPRFAVSAGDLRINGSANYSPKGGGLDKVNVSQVSYNRTDLAGVIIPGQDGGWTVSFHGPSFDLEPMFDDLFKTSPDDDEDEGAKISLSVKIDKIWTGKDRFVKQVTGTFSRADKRWRGIVVDGTAGDGKKFEVRLKPSGVNKRTVSIKAENAGDLL